MHPHWAYWLTGGDTAGVEEFERIVDGIPIVLLEPEGETPREVILWMSHFRRRMWPILGQTTVEAMRVLTWAQEQTGRSGSARAGGVSMGGDVAVALAGIDVRVGRVATIGSTPVWSRPDMRELGDSSKRVEQGNADPYAQWFADQLDPWLHLERYRDGAAISFELGEDDHHVPAENARRFVGALLQREPAAADRLRLQTWPGLDHFGITTDPDALTAAAEWLLDGQS